MDKKIKQVLNVIIFDLDRTIFDWDQVQILARLKVDKLLEYYEIDPHDFWLSYDKHHDALFQSFVQHELTAKEYRIIRFQKPLECFQIFDRSLAIQLNDCFIDFALNQAIFCDGAEEALQICKQYPVKRVVLSNGPAHGQRKKIEKLKLHQWFDAFYISEEREIAKPAPQAFLQICDDFNVLPCTCLMVGDDLEMDILPAIQTGMQAFWVKNPIKFQQHHSHSPRHLTELKSVLETFDFDYDHESENLI
ncbi:HAD family hydrolase [Acinetobacter shaoyimingii]|uniref:HAD family hydrolase n=1 Tax=Acinetobacter shaoyimingii TaxID=2715164 RepID=A0A6G8RY55_9GAMM|nr:HAD family hydrolase [Acinetobacter shaoyimingii]QIO06801.1 HAD family hydrolase [Acinetobacter shaoyimingii]